MIRLMPSALDVDKLRAAMPDTAAGALVVFEGWVRSSNGGRAVLRLEYEGAEPIAQNEFSRIVADARRQFNIIAVLCEHRTGVLAPGELAVWLGVTAAHRGDAFAACRYILDELKARLPIWKKEHYADGDSGWINAP